MPPLKVFDFGLVRDLVCIDLGSKKLGDRIWPVRSGNGCNRGDYDGLGALWLISQNACAVQVDSLNLARLFA